MNPSNGAVEAARKICQVFDKAMGNVGIGGSVPRDEFERTVQSVALLVESSTQVSELRRKQEEAYKLAADALAMPNWNQDEMILTLTNICKTLGSSI